MSWAHETAYKKANKTKDTWQKRNICKRFTNLFTGDLAKNIIAGFLVSQIQDINGFLIEYDRIRTDNFENDDLFDLKIKSHKDECELEIKSSGEKYSNNLTDIYNGRRIIINKNSPHSHLACIYTQVMFVPQNLSFFKNENIIKCDDLADFALKYKKDFENSGMKALIVGYADKDIQEEALKSHFSVQNRQANAKERDYANLLIRDSKTPDEMISYVKSFCK
ncbi:MAG: hypothetical protein ACYCSQ_00545 [bacterium]